MTGAGWAVGLRTVEGGLDHGETRAVVFVVDHQLDPAADVVTPPPEGEPATRLDRFDHAADDGARRRR